MSEQVKAQLVSYGKLCGLLGFMAFLYLNLLAGGVITIALLSVVIKYITGV